MQPDASRVQATGPMLCRVDRHDNVQPITTPMSHDLHIALAQEHIANRHRAAAVARTAPARARRKHARRYWTRLRKRRHAALLARTH
jgi:hypothetical protein